MRAKQINFSYSQEVQGDIKVTTYDRTPIMSTYLVAFVVGEFDYVEARDRNNVLIRVYTPVGKSVFIFLILICFTLQRVDLMYLIL